MTKAEWLKRCAARFEERGGCSKELAWEMAQSCFYEKDGDFLTHVKESPEDCADEDMSYWSNDYE